MAESILTKRKPLLRGYEPLAFGIVNWGTLNELAYGNKKNISFRELVPVDVEKRPYNRKAPYRKRGPLSEETKFKISQTLLAKKNEKNNKGII